MGKHKQLDGAPARTMSSSVGIIDYGSGNFRSVCNWVDANGSTFGPIQRGDDIEKYTHVILPGVGSFGGAMSKLIDLDLVEPIKNLIASDAKPFLGICVGMQIMAELGLEFGRTDGLSVIKGATTLLDNTEQGGTSLTLPHIGWNSVIPNPEARLFLGSHSELLEFYFLHSYHLDSTDPEFTFSTAFYGQSFNAAVERKNFFAVQFHPEKSQQSGSVLLQRFLEF